MLLNKPSQETKVESPEVPLSEQTKASTAMPWLPGQYVMKWSERRVHTFRPEAKACVPTSCIPWTRIILWNQSSVHRSTFLQVKQRHICEHVVYHGNESSDEAEVEEVVWVDTGGRVDLKTVVAVAGILKQAVHGVQHVVGQVEKPLPDNTPNNTTVTVTISKC